LMFGIDPLPCGLDRDPVIFERSTGRAVRALVVDEVSAAVLRTRPGTGGSSPEAGEDRRRRVSAGISPASMSRAASVVRTAGGQHAFGERLLDIRDPGRSTRFLACWPKTGSRPARVHRSPQHFPVQDRLGDRCTALPSRRGRIMNMHVRLELRSACAQPPDRPPTTLAPGLSGVGRGTRSSRCSRLGEYSEFRDAGAAFFDATSRRPVVPTTVRVGEHVLSHRVGIAVCGLAARVRSTCRALVAASRRRALRCASSPAGTRSTRCSPLATRPSAPRPASRPLGPLAWRRDALTSRTRSAGRDATAWAPGRSGIAPSCAYV